MHRGNILSTSGGYHEYIGEYHEHIGGYSIHWRDTMIHVGNIISTLRMFSTSDTGGYLGEQVDKNL